VNRDIGLKALAELKRITPRLPEPPAPKEPVETTIMREKLAWAAWLGLWPVKHEGKTDDH
jgi:hypothetical protein